MSLLGDLFRRYQANKAQKQYEKSVRFRMDKTPYGSMYGQAARHGRRQAFICPERIQERQSMREEARRVFLSHPAATEADFERCWPTIRDELFVRHTLNSLLMPKAMKAVSGR